MRDDTDCHGRQRRRGYGRGQEEVKYNIAEKAIKESTLYLAMYIHVYS